MTAKKSEPEGYQQLLRTGKWPTGVDGDVSSRCTKTANIVSIMNTCAAAQQIKGFKRGSGKKDLSSL